MLRKLFKKNKNSFGVDDSESAGNAGKPVRMVDEDHDELFNAAPLLRRTNARIQMNENELPPPRQLFEDDDVDEDEHPPALPASVNHFGSEPLQIQTNIPEEIPTAPSTPTNSGIQNSMEPPRLVRQNARPGYYEQVELQIDDSDVNDVFNPPQQPRQSLRSRRRNSSLPGPEYNSSGGLVQFGKFVKKYMKLGNSRQRAIAKYRKALLRQFH